MFKAPFFHLERGGLFIGSAIKKGIRSRLESECPC